MFAAYNEVEDWLDQLLDYLKGNRDYLISFIGRTSKLKVVVPEATYLIWMDCRSLGMGSTELCLKIYEEAGLRINDGRTFGEAGEGFIRINIACPKTLLKKGLERLERVINSR